MNTAANDVIREMEHFAAEYLEMDENPSQQLCRILAWHVADLRDQNEYLKQRLENVSRELGSAYARVN